MEDFDDLVARKKKKKTKVKEVAAAKKEKRKADGLVSVEKNKKKKKEGKSSTSASLVQKDVILKQEEVLAKEINKGEKKKKRKKEKKKIMLKKDEENIIAADKASEAIQEGKPVKSKGEERKNKVEKKKRKREDGNITVSGKASQDSKDQILVEAQRDVSNSKQLGEAGKSKKSSKKKAKSNKKEEHGALNEGDSALEKVAEHDTSKEDGSVLEKRVEHERAMGVESIPEKREEANKGDVYYISSAANDCSKGMKKWLRAYHQSRPGLKVLQQRIDEFITAHEEKLEQPSPATRASLSFLSCKGHKELNKKVLPASLFSETKEREALVAGDGWTVVKHEKGRKKTTDADSGITVGSVAPAVAATRMLNKKSVGVGPNFYRFHKQEAKKNEILVLQSKFEQDKKRMQQLRAARKFRPY